MQGLGSSAMLPQVLALSSPRPTRRVQGQGDRPARRRVRHRVDRGPGPRQRARLGSPRLAEHLPRERPRRRPGSCLRTRSGSGGGLDPVGAPAAVTALAAVLVPLALGPEHGWTVWAVCCVLAVVPAVLLWERRLSRCGGNRVLLRTAGFRAGVAANGAFMAYFAGFMFMLTSLLQNGLGLSSVAAGWCSRPRAPRSSPAAAGRQRSLRAGHRPRHRPDGSGQRPGAPSLVGTTFIAVRPERDGSAAAVLATSQQFAGAGGVALVGSLLFKGVGRPRDRRASWRARSTRGAPTSAERPRRHQPRAGAPVTRPVVAVRQEHQGSRRTGRGAVAGRGFRLGHSVGSGRIRTARRRPGTRPRRPGGGPPRPRGAWLSRSSASSPGVRPRRRRWRPPVGRPSCYSRARPAAAGSPRSGREQPRGVPVQEEVPGLIVEAQVV